MKSLLISVDVEADGPIPYKYSMISFGAVVVEEGLKRTFYGQLKPISNIWVPEALAVSGHTREETELFDEPDETMSAFSSWLEDLNARPIFISDNPAFDWQFINYYFHTYQDKNPFGFSAKRIGCIYSGMQKDITQSVQWKRFRVTKHTHNPVDDAKGNAEALLKMRAMGLVGI
jgi:DNA polymerase III epsilon subunit-like protein